MALTLSLASCQSNGCKLLTLTDNTGLYQAITNPGGWNSPNVDLNTEVSIATLSIIDPAGATHLVDIINDLGFDFTTAIWDTLEYEVDNTYLGLASDIALSDGIYNVTYTIRTIAADYTVERNFAVMCNTACDIANLIKLIPEQYNCNKCNTDYINQVFLCYMLYQSALSAAYCGSESEYNNIMTSLTTLINNTKYEL